MILVNMGNRLYQSIKYNRKEQTTKKVDKLREKEKLGMEKHRHPSMGTLIPCTLDLSMISTSFPYVKCMHSMEYILFPTST
jgi:hypothetical protein